MDGVTDDFVLGVLVSITALILSGMCVIGYCMWIHGPQSARDGSDSEFVEEHFAEAIGSGEMYE